VDADVEETDEAPAAEEQERALREFSPELQPYGRWVDDPVYGRVWVPLDNVVGRDFTPYVSGGHWELTANDEWFWASDYPFGGITFHYGRWASLSGGSWGWVPGYRYAPAWVDFRIGAAGYVGWGPLAPYSVWRNGVFVSLGVVRPNPYIFCPTTYVFARSMPRYVVRDRYRVRSIEAQTYRYRPYSVSAGRAQRYRYPTPSEARIPRQALPARRVVAQPRYLGGARLASQRVQRVDSGRAQGGRFQAGAQSRPSYLRRDSDFRAPGNARRSTRDFGQDRRGWNDSGRGASRDPRNNRSTYSPPVRRPYDSGGSSGAWSSRPRQEVRSSTNPGWGNRMPAVNGRQARPAPAANGPRREYSQPRASGRSDGRGDTRGQRRAPSGSGSRERGRSHETRGSSR
jgi:hypothetical protein